MASQLASSSKLFLLLCCILSSQAFDFDVGDETGWIVPSSKDNNFYNHWASRNRFKVGDSVKFKYGKDSVMVVMEEDYESCLSLHPLFFSNNGDTEFKLDRSGTFYFISGVSGHCERGQKMIIKVMSHADDNAPGGSPSGGNETANPSPPGTSHANGAVHTASGWLTGVAPASLELIALLACGFTLLVC